MKKSLFLSILVSLVSASLFAVSITNGVLPIPSDSTGSTFFIEAKASEQVQGLLLKYGDTDSSAELVTDTITKSDSAAWDVFGNEETKNFYFFGTGRSTDAKVVTVTAAASSFQNGQVDTEVIPTITSYDYNTGWTVTIDASNPVGIGRYTGTSFTIAWDGSTSDNIDVTPSGTYYTEITLNISDV